MIQRINPILECLTKRHTAVVVEHKEVIDTEEKMVPDPFFDIHGFVFGDCAQAEIVFHF